ncbi:hypothetical protein JTB14_023237 [Gonioctena quinquepunctata]|nr:hypothetical protein JTB14_023237 [Gonioctena quinquepunctata]
MGPLRETSRSLSEASKPRLDSRRLCSPRGEAPEPSTKRIRTLGSTLDDTLRVGEIRGMDQTKGSLFYSPPKQGSEYAFIQKMSTQLRYQAFSTETWSGKDRGARRYKGKHT